MNREQAIQLIHGYFDDALSEEDLLRLRDWLAESPEHVDLYAELCQVHTAIQRTLEVNDLGDSIHTLLKNKNADSGQTIDVGTAIEQPASAHEPLEIAPLPELPEYHEKPAKRRKSRRDGAGLSNSDHQPVVNMLGVRVYQRTIDGEPQPRRIGRYLAAAVVMIAATLGVIIWNESQTPDEMVATLTADNGLTWDGVNAERTIGSKLATGLHITTQGVGEIAFDRGATVLLDGPCRFVINNDNEMTLHEGRIVAHITPEAANFTVHTPKAKVVDLGTEFGVEVDAQGKTLTAVFQGKVDLTGRDANKSAANNVVLSAGWQGVVSRTGNVEPEVKKIPYDHAFTRTIDDARNELDLELSGQIKWNRRAPMTVRPERFHTDGYAVVFNESRNVELPQAVKEVIRDPGRYQAYELKNRMRAIKAGRVVDSYLVHYDADVTGETDNRTIRATIRFPRPIRGVVASNMPLFNTDKLFRKPDTRYPLAAYSTGIRGIDRGDGMDLIEIHPDGQTITFQFSGQYYDHVRILIDSEADKPGA